MIIVNIFAFIILCVSLFFYKRLAGSISLNNINTISFLLYRDIIPVVFIGSFLIYNNFVNNHPVIAMISDEIKVKGYLFALYSILFMPLGMYIANLFFKINSGLLYKEYLKRDLDLIFSEKSYRTIILYLLGISFLILFYIFINSPSIPMISTLRGDSELASIQRRDNKVNFGGIIYIKNILGYYFVPLVTYYIYCLKYKFNSNFFKLAFIFSLIMTVILLTFDTQKAPIVYFVLGMLVVETLIKGKIPFMKLIIVFITSAFLIIMMYIIVTKQEIGNLLKFDSVIMYRLFVGQIGGYYLSLEWFPNVISDHTYFSGLPTFILNFFGINNIESARLLMMYFNPEGIKLGNAGLISSYYLGEAWANYGLIGLLISPIVVGFVVQSVHNWLITSKKDPFNIALYSIVTIKWVITGGFVGFLFLKVLIIPFLLLLFYKLVLSLIIKIKL
ncbi:O-antigen polymerase [Solibacillus silvestris]